MRVSERNETCLIAERKQFRICKMQKRKITKTQKCKKGAISIFPIDKENA
jgi:hypothetical protein